MKKLTLFAILISAIAQAQDTQFIGTLNKISTESEAVKIADNIAATAPVKLRFFKSKEFADDHALIVRFVPEGLTDQQYNNLDTTEQEAFLTVKYDIDATGQKSYRLKQVSGTFQMLLPFWKKYFRPDADADRTMKDTKLQKLIDRSKKIDYYFQEDNDGWILRNQS